MILLFKVTLEHRNKDYLHQADEWCSRMWPFTQGATWCQSRRSQHILPDDGYYGVWLFQREEDATLFRLTWS